MPGEAHIVVKTTSRAVCANPGCDKRSIRTHGLIRSTRLRWLMRSMRTRWPWVSRDAILRISTCGCPKPCRGWSGGSSVFVDESVAVCRSDDSKLLLSVGVRRLGLSGISLINPGELQ